MGSTIYGNTEPDNRPFGVKPPPKRFVGALPIGGFPTQLLVKKTEKNFDAEWKDGIAGPAGPAGADGAAGAQGQTGAAGAGGDVSWTAGEVIGSPRVIMLEAGLAKLFTQSVEAIMGNAIAISKTSVIIGALVTATISGELQSAGSFVAGSIYYAGAASGSLATSPPATGIFLRVGTARTNDILVIEFSEPVMQI
jgi:hypothetical protein